MIDQKKISRRTFVFGVAVAGVCEATTPLINLNQKQPLLIDFSRNRDFFKTFEDDFFSNNKGLYFDPEPELPVDQGTNLNFVRKFQYRPKRNFDLKLVNANTGEIIFKKIRMASLNNGINYADLDYFFRDWRENKIIKMNRQVIDILFKISERSLGSSDSLTVDITSGYRTKKTNSYLRTVSKNVAKNSLHMKGKAIDFSISGVSNGKLNNIAKDYAVGGLGVYKNFVHIDSGPFRRWSS